MSHGAHCLAQSDLWPRYGSGDRGPIPGRERFFCSLHSLRPPVGTPQSSVPWVQVFVPSGVKQQECEANHSFPSSTEVKIRGAILLSPVRRFMARCLLFGSELCSPAGRGTGREEVEWESDRANQQATTYPVYATNIHSENMPLRWEAGDRQPVLCVVDRICPWWIIFLFCSAWQILKEISM
jgi:hypothetical protein